MIIKQKPIDLDDEDRQDRYQRDDDHLWKYSSEDVFDYEQQKSVSTEQILFR